jgi:ribonucleoside-diphosphate reductase alpha chain
MTEKKLRPKLVHGETTKVATGCGNLYVTVNKDGENPIEVFATLGKSGDCTRCQVEALTRCISTGLQYNVPLENFVKQLSGIRCPNIAFGGEKGETILSCPDAIARILKQYVKEEMP